MGYQALYRRYRPARFDDFVGQEAVIRTLRSQVMSGRIAHAYLFCGTRGTGKTSTAKVFARAVNCEQPDRGEPCGQCAVCRALGAESSLDILEIDAASNNGVDEIRDLREKVKYPPQNGRYRVYIIDEVHMLSQGAFNALLKTLEEPPSYVVFILATTEPQKLPATILSRCQRFDFGRIPSHQIIARLRVALEEGGIRAQEAALSRIARAAEGGMRDAWSIMDMCLGYAQEGDGGLTEELVLQVLGAADRRFLFEFADSLIGADAPAALRMIDDMMRAGREVQVFVRDVSAHLRALMLADVCGEEHAAQLLDVTQEDAAAYVAQAKRTSHTRLMRMLDLFLQSETDMKWAAHPRFALEAAALRACEPEESLQLEALISRVDELERKLREGVVMAQPAGGRAQKTAAAPAQQEMQQPAMKEAPKGPAPEAERVWQETLRLLKQKPQIYGMARLGRLATSENGLFTVVFEKA
ncbi:MAG: DNA polymerase III subunit gamma/tau, partial [Clostridia bacterium]|nr:DNA polymerase III subunit gamma/tau [Clostridia bacterium]